MQLVEQGAVNELSGTFRNPAGTVCACLSVCPGSAVRRAGGCGGGGERSISRANIWKVLYVQGLRDPCETPAPAYHRINAPSVGDCRQGIDLPAGGKFGAIFLGFLLLR